MYSKTLNFKFYNSLKYKIKINKYPKLSFDNALLWNSLFFFLCFIGFLEHLILWSVFDGGWSVPIHEPWPVRPRAGHDPSYFRWPYMLMNVFLIIK